MALQVSAVSFAQSSVILPLKKNQYLLGSCIIFDSNLKLVLQLPGGTVCLPMENGHLVASDQVKLRHYDEHGKEVWSLSGDYHHQLIKVDQSIFALKAETKDFKDYKIRYDVVEKIDLSGKVISRFLLNEEKLSLNIIPTTGLARYPDRSAKDGSVFELSHANSIQFFKHGFVVNDLAAGHCFFLDKDLKFKKTLKIFEFAQAPSKKTSIAGRYLTHDCQLSSEEKGFIFINDYFDQKFKLGYRMAEFQHDKIVKILPESHYETNETEHGGGVLNIGKNWLLSAVLGKVSNANKVTEVLYVSGSNGKVIKKWELPFYVQDLKIVNLGAFIKNSDFL